MSQTERADVDLSDDDDVANNTSTSTSNELLSYFRSKQNYRSKESVFSSGVPGP